MHHRLPADVPESGKRYDLILTSAGIDNKKRELAHFLIDNGKFKGVRVSEYLTPAVKQSLMKATGLTSNEVAGQTLDSKKLELRVSAKIDVTRLRKDGHGIYHPVDESYDKSNVFILYELSEFDEPSGDSEMQTAAKKTEQKFKRKPAAKKKTAPKKKVSKKEDAD